MANPASPNSYVNYIDPVEGYLQEDQLVSRPAHLYTLHLVRSVFNEEICELYQKYERTVH